MERHSESKGPEVRECWLGSRHSKMASATETGVNEGQTVDRWLEA